MAAWTELPPTGGLPECAALVQLAERLRWSAAELVIQYANRALAESAAAGGPLAVRAQALVAAALVRLGRHAEAVEPAVAALRDADQAGVPELVPAIRLDLAACAHGLGESLLGCTILRPVLENLAGRPSTRAIAITALVGCTAHVGRRDDLEDSLAEAERLLAADDALSPDARRMERAQLAMRTAAYYRRYGETEDAVDAARDGLGLLTKLRDPRLEGGLAKAGLTLELVCALLDDGELAEAERVAEPLLAEPVRSASAASVGRLMLAMVTRVHVPAGRVEHGRSLLGHATWIAERHDHDWLLADAHTTLAQLDEVSGQPSDALLALRSARVAEQRQLRRVDAAKRQLMIEFGARPMPLDTVNSLLRNVVRTPVSAAPAPGTPAMLPPVRSPLPAPQVAGKTAEPEPADTDEATGLLTREGLSRRIQAVRSANRPVALTLVRLDPVDGEGRGGADRDATAADGSAPDALTTLAGRVRDIAPEDAELARSDGSELAVLLPHTTRDEAEEFAATIRESAIESDWLTEASGQEVSISTGVAQSGSATDEDADSLLTAARETLTMAEADRPAPVVPDPPSSDDLLLSTLQAAAGETDAGYQEIRDLLAPLLGHPTLKRTDPDATRPDSDPTQPKLGKPQPHTDPAEPWAGQPPPHAEPAAGQSPPPEPGPDPVRSEPDPDSAQPSDPDSGSSQSWGGRPLLGADAAAGQSPSPESGSESGQRWEPDSDSLQSGVGRPQDVDAAAEQSGVADSDSVRAAELDSERTQPRVGQAVPGGEAVDGQSPLVEADDDPLRLWLGRSLQGADTAGRRSPASEGDRGESTLPMVGRSVQHADVARRQTVPSEPEPDDIPEPPRRRPDIIVPKEPDSVPILPEEPDSIPPFPPKREPLPEVPPPTTIPDQPDQPDQPEPEQEPAPEPEQPQREPEREPWNPVEESRLDATLGPVQGPEPRPDDLLHRSLRRPERSEATSIAELLTEALVAYQETTPDDEDGDDGRNDKTDRNDLPKPPPPVPEPASHERMYYEHTEPHPSGRHRLPDWDSGV